MPSSDVAQLAEQAAVNRPGGGSTPPVGASLAFRRAEGPDLPFIVSSWVDSYRTAHAAGMIPMPMYDRTYREAVAWVLARPGVQTWVAFHPGAEGSGADLYGWCSVEHGVELPVRMRRTRGARTRWEEDLADAGCPLVHYVFVKQAYRRLGLGRRLLEAAGVDPRSRFLFSCKTALVSELPLPPGSRFAPLAARFPRRGG